MITATTHKDRELIEIPATNENSAREDENAKQIIDCFLSELLMEELPPLKRFREYVVKHIRRNDEQAERTDFKEARKAEVNGLNHNNIWKVRDESTVPENAIVLGGRSDMALKNYRAPSGRRKVQLVAHESCDRDKPYIVHDTATSRASSNRLILSAATYHSFRKYSYDLPEANLQRKENLTLQIFIKSKDEKLKSLQS